MELNVERVVCHGGGHDDAFTSVAIGRSDKLGSSPVTIRVPLLARRFRAPVFVQESVNVREDDRQIAHHQRDRGLKVEFFKFKSTIPGELDREHTSM